MIGRESEFPPTEEGKSQNQVGAISIRIGL